MSDDASLSEFAGGGDGEGSDGDREDPDSAETPTYTYTSTPDGAECDACGEVVEERWHAGEGGTAENPELDPDALVCADCKEW